MDVGNGCRRHISQNLSENVTFQHKLIKTISEGHVQYCSVPYRLDYLPEILFFLGTLPIDPLL